MAAMNKLPNARGFTWRETGGLPLLTADLLTTRHAFTGRRGGVSGGIWASLNLGERRGDDPTAVRENWRRLCAALALDETRLVYARQTHAAAVRIVGEADCHAPLAPVPYEGDGYVTNVPGIALAVFVADCVPVLLEEPRAGVIAAVHCGWRGTVGDILGSAAAAMRTLGADPAEIRAAIGPGIGPCCFETGPEVPRAIADLLGEADARPLCPPEPGVPGKYLPDLPGVCRARLIQLGVRPEHIALSGLCTRCHADLFWSHRATQGQRGSQLAIISLPGKEPDPCANF